MHWERALGAVLGALCGDAAGATLEFAVGKIQASDVERAVTMPGGGVFRLGPGQITDDSELALSLARGLLGHSPRDGFPMESVARQYALWFESKPFDIGITCSKAFGAMPDGDKRYAGNMTAAATQFCMESEANGTLMRLTPLGLWLAGEKEETIVEMAKKEATLSHPSPVCQDANAVYCLLLDHLLRVPGDSEGALAKAETFVKEHVHTRVREWFLEESLDISELVCTRQIGHVRWGLVLAVHFLRVKAPYEYAIKETLLKGGDTDTNAAIVGGIIGALHGVDGVPMYMRSPVRIFDCTDSKTTRRPRPELYKGSHMEDLARQLVIDKLVE